MSSRNGQGACSPVFREFLKQGDLSDADEMFGPDVAFLEAKSRLHCMLLFIPAILTPILLSSCLAISEPRIGPESPGFYLSAPELLKLSRALGSPDASDGTWERIITVGYQAPGLEPNGLTAYEENPLFIYAFGHPSELHGKLPERRPSGREPARQPSLWMMKSTQGDSLNGYSLRDPSRRPPLGLSPSLKTRVN